MQRHFPMLVMLATVVSGCVGDTICIDGSYTCADEPPSNPVPIIDRIEPAGWTQGDSGITVTVFGSNFVQASVVRVGGADRATIYRSSSVLEAELPAADFAVSGVFQITVSNPPPGGGSSNAVPLTVEAAAGIAPIRSLRRSSSPGVGQEPRPPQRSSVPINSRDYDPRTMPARTRAAFAPALTSSTIRLVTFSAKPRCVESVRSTPSRWTTMSSGEPSASLP